MTNVTKGFLAVLATCWVFAAFAVMPARAATVCEASKVCDFTNGNIGYKACLGRLAKDQDRELNRLYSQLRSMLRGSDADGSIGGGERARSWPLFKKGQKFWLKFRDHQCEAESQVAHGGTAASGYYANCLCNLTYHRNNDFKRMLDDYSAR